MNPGRLHRTNSTDRWDSRRTLVAPSAYARVWRRSATVRNIKVSVFFRGAIIFVRQHDDREQRKAIERMLVDADYAGVAILDWLEHFFETRLSDRRAAAKTALQPMPSAANNVLVCKGCEKEFASQTALNGHGEGRCRRRHNK
mgnify:CR=1 FL=1